MNATFKPDIAIAYVLPDNLEELAPPPSLLPGESLERYQFMRRAIFSDIAPASAMEWLIAIDVVELSWEIERYRLLRHKILERFREQAIEDSLRRIDMVEIPPERQEVANLYIRQNASNWRTDPDAACEIEARLTAHGIDQMTINAETYVQAQEILILFQALLDAAQTRRVSLLREIRLLRLANTSGSAIRRQAGPWH
jgi:hypothetical protein